MKRSKLFCVCALAMLAGCGRMDSKGVAEYVKGEMQRELVKQGALKELVVENVTLVHREGNIYAGVGTGVVRGVPLKFDVSAEYDGASVLWAADLADDNELTVQGKVMGKELREKIAASWPGIKAEMKTKCREARDAAGAYYNAAKAKYYEYKDKAFTMTETSSVSCPTSTPTMRPAQGK